MSKNINGSITQFEYDGLNPVQELDGANPANVTANLLTGLNIDEYFARTDSNGAMNFLTDALGSTLALTDSSGAINTSYTYEPFGNTSAAGSNPNPYQFTGREDDGIGLYFYRSRYYSPSFQRFIAQDPIAFRGGDMNLYGYVRQQPITGVDPLGLYWDLNFTGGFLIVITGASRFQIREVLIFTAAWGSALGLAVVLRGPKEIRAAAGSRASKPNMAPRRNSGARRPEIL